MVHTAQDKLRDLLQSKAGLVTARQMELVLAKVDLLVDKELADEATLCSNSKQELVQWGISPGAATALKTMFPELPAASVAGAGVSGPDRSQDHIQLLMPRALASLPTVNELPAYFRASSELRVPVTDRVVTVLQAQGSPGNSLVAGGCDSVLSTRMSGLILFVAEKRRTEVDTTGLIMQHIKTTFYSLAEFGPEETRVPFALFFNKAQTGVSSESLSKGSRADFSMTAWQCLLFFGEDKQADDMQSAVDDIRKKVTGIPPLHRGSVNYMLAYAAAGSQVRLYGVHLDQQKVQLTALSEELDLDTAHGRAAFIITLAKVYALLRCMGQYLPELARRLPYGQRIQRGTEYSRVYLYFSLKGHATKQIQGFSGHAMVHQTSIETLQQAYKIAAAAASEEQAANRPPYIIRALEAPTFRAPLDLYHVRTTPVGYRWDPTSEEEMRGLALACCKALAVLHPMFVHRDLRLPNVLRQAGGDAWMLIDLENVTPADLVVPIDYELAAWGSGTLDAGRFYRTTSDMYQLAVLLKTCGVPVESLSRDAINFITKLETKALTATEALGHPWLLGAQ